MPGIRDEVELDVTAALAAIDSIGASLTQQVQQFQVQMASSLDVLRAGPAIDLSGLTTGVAEASSAIEQFAASNAIHIAAVNNGLQSSALAAKSMGSEFQDAVPQAGALAGAVDGITAAAGGLVSQLGPAAEAIGIAFGTKELIDGIISSSEAAAGLDVQIKQIPIIFGQASQSITDFTENSVANLALGQASATQYANQLGRVFTAQGIGQQQAATLTTELLTRAADVATATGLTTDQVLSKFSGGLVGMSRAVRDLGAAFSVQEVEAKAASLGLTEVNGKYDEGALIQARAAIILDKTGYAVNQLADNQDSLLVKQRTLSAEWQNASTTLGQQLIPVMIQLVDSFEGALPTLEKFASSAVPLLSAAVQIAVPILLTFLNTLKPITEAFKLASDVVGLVPKPLRDFGLSILGVSTSSDKAAATTKAAAKTITDAGTAADGASGGVDKLGSAMSSLVAASAATDDAVKAVTTDLDAGFGKYLNAAGAVDTLQSAVYKLGEELGKGPAKGQPMVDYQASLQRDLQATVKDVEANALAMASAGQITADATSVNAEMVRELQALAAEFPGLNGQIEDYINLLEHIPKAETTLVTIETLTNAQTDPNQLGLIDSAAALNAGQDAANQIRDGLLSKIGEIGDAGRQAGAAAASAATAAAKTTLLQSASQGLDIGGFLIEGIILDPGQAHQRDLNNYFGSLIQGIGTTVQDAIKIDPTESASILAAIEKVAQDTRDLGDARDTLGVDSIEAAKAAAQLALDEADVNKVVLDATDSTKAYTAALKTLSDGVNAVTSAFHALEDAQKAQQSVGDAQKEVDDTTARLALLDRTIADREARLASTTDAVDARRLQETIAQLQQQRDAQAGTVQDAQTKLTDAQLGLVDSQQKIVDAAQAAEKSQGQWETYFRNLAGAAGLSQVAVDSLVKSLEQAGSVSTAISTGILAGNPVGGTTNPLQGTLLGAQPAGPVYHITINGADGPTATAQELVNETRAVALTAG